MLRCHFDALVSWKLASITAGSCSSSAPQQSPGPRVAAAPEVADSGAYENAFRKGALPMQRCRRLTAGTAPARALGSGEAIARLGWP